MFGELLKISYLCIVEIKLMDSALASQKLFLGLTIFTVCPARKNIV